MRKKVVAVLIALLSLIVVSSAFADVLENKIKEQQKNIDKAIASKALTKQEVGIVQENLNRVKSRLAKVKADKKFNENEKANINSMLDKNAKMIADKKNNPAKPIHKPDIEQRIENQQRRIDGGIKSGALTKKEADVAQDNLNNIKMKATKMKKDNTLTDKEENKLHDLLDENSQMIADKKNNPVKKLDVK